MCFCATSEDKPAVPEISKKLADQNIKAWLDEDESWVPGGIMPSRFWFAKMNASMDVLPPKKTDTRVFVFCADLLVGLISRRFRYGQGRNPA